MSSVAVLTSSVTNERIFRNALGKIGFGPIETFGTTGEFLARLKSQPSDLIVIQKNLLTAGDNHLLEVVRVDLTLEQPVLVTGYQFSKDEAIELIRRGASELLLLPFNPETLAEKIGNLKLKDSPLAHGDE